MKEAFATEARCAALLRGVAWPGRPFLIDGLSHAQLHRQAGRLYHFFQRTGQKAPICLASDDKSVCAAALLAALAGGPPLFLPYALSPQALSALQAAGGCIQALCTPELELPKGMQRLPLPEELGEDENPLPAIPAQGPILHLFTGGSTGAPQLWSKTAANLFGEALFIASHHGITAEDRIAASILPYHIYGLLYSVLLPLVSGAAVLAESPSFPEEMVAAVRGRDISILISVPAHYRALAGRSCAPSALRLAFSSAGMLDAADNQAFCQANQVGVVEVYGSTETGGIACRNRFLGEEDFTILPPIAWRQSPEERLMLRSPFLSPELALDQEGFFHAADRIAPKSGNSFSLLGRADLVVKVGGTRVDLETVRLLLHNQPGVREALVLALPTDNGRENRIAAVVTPISGQRLDTEALRHALARHLEPYALPRILKVVERIPVRANGKYDREATIALVRG